MSKKAIKNANETLRYLSLGSYHLITEEMYKDLLKIFKTINYDEKSKQEILRVAYASTHTNTSLLTNEDIKCIDDFDSSFNSNTLGEIRALIQ